jgi:hypothetical protein
MNPQPDNPATHPRALPASRIARAIDLASGAASWTR